MEDHKAFSCFSFLPGYRCRLFFFRNMPGFTTLPDRILQLIGKTPRVSAIASDTDSE